MQHVPLAPEPQQWNKPEEIKIRSGWFSFQSNQREKAEKQVLCLLAAAGHATVQSLDRVAGQPVSKAIHTG